MPTAHSTTARRLMLSAAALILLLPGHASVSAAGAAPETLGPQAVGYTLTPLLTGGILTTERYVKLDQTIARRTVDVPCSYADGQFHLTQTTTASGLVDLGYPNVPRASPALPTSSLPDATASGSYSFSGGTYACDGSVPFLAQGGSCTRSFSPQTASIFQPQQHTLAPLPYTPVTSSRVVATTSYDPGFNCLMYSGRIPMAPGAYILDFHGDAQYDGAFVTPRTVAKGDSATSSADMAKNDTSCVNGADWWLNQHSTGIYTWTGWSTYGGPPDGTTATCSSVRSGYSRSTVQRALAVREVRLFQMTPAGGYVEVLPGQKVVDGNTVKVQMTIENRWKRSITAPIELRDDKHNRKLEPEKGQQNPFTDTFAAGQVKTVTFLWRTDGVAWESEAAPIYSRDIDIMSPVGGARFTVSVAPRPVLLVHGWRSSAATWETWPGFVSSVRSDWRVTAVTGMDTDPETGRSIQSNAITLGGAIRDARVATGAVHVDLVAHSMGGLISRWFLSRLMSSPPPDGRPLIRSLTMFGTPHLGSDCATGILALANMSLGSGEASAEADRWARGRGWIPTIQLTPTYLMGAFRAATPKVAGVHYSHVSGNRFPVFPCGAFGNQSGPNDGPVVVPSSIGNGLGGRALSAPRPVPHVGIGEVGMTGSVNFFRIALLKVLGLSPAAAPRLISMSATSLTPAAVVAPVARAITRTAAQGTVASPPSLVSPGGTQHLVVEAPAGVRVEVKTPAGTVVARVRGGLTARVVVTTPAGRLRFAATGPSTARILVSMIEATGWFTASATRSGRVATVTAIIDDDRATSFTAVGVSGSTVGTIVHLSRISANVYRAKVTLPAGNSVALLIRGARGTAHRTVVVGI